MELISYQVKQADLEIKHLQDSLSEKLQLRKKLFSLLSPQQQAEIDGHKDKLYAPPGSPGK
jgi:hypothetical protein